MTHTHASLPSHGWLNCRNCFEGEERSIEIGDWRVVNDPGAWGAAEPEVLVLGFSKGFTQANAARSGNFDAVPFKGMRPRLTEALHAIGLLSTGQRVDDRMKASETRFAFGSLVRCSLSRRNGYGQYECTGKVMPLAFKETIASTVARCAQTFLGNLPKSVRLIVMLGTTDAYIAGCREVVRALRPAEFKDINSVSYQMGRVLFTHVSHPSPLNGHHGTWLHGPSSSKPGRKREAAVMAVRSCIA